MLIPQSCPDFRRRAETVFSLDFFTSGAEKRAGKVRDGEISSPTRETRALPRRNARQDRERFLDVF